VSRLKPTGGSNPPLSAIFALREVKQFQKYSGDIWIVRTFYNILFAVFFALSSPFYFLKMRRRGGEQWRKTKFDWRKGFGQRFARYDARLKQAITNRHTLWMHAVSVGEVNVCTQLIKALEPRFPNLKIVVSTTTTTGMERLQNVLPSHVSKIYYPLDLRGWVSRALNTIRPEAVVLVEAEIWPNFLWKAINMRIPLFLVNARLSNRSYRGYKRAGFLFRRLFRAFTGVGAQNEVDAARLKELGCRPEAIRVVGSLKYDAARVDERRLLDVPGMLRQLGMQNGARMIVGGSIHKGEEIILSEQFLRLQKKFPDLFLVLVPRHFELCREMGKELEARGLKFAYRSEIVESTRYRPGEVQCLLVNSMGELKHFYEHATVVFIGKSLAAKGGQNPIEAAALGKPVVFGPNMSEFAEITRNFLEKDAAVQVQNEAELEGALETLLANETRRNELGRNALKVVRENLGSIERTVNMIVKHLEGGELYVAPARM
jgi:3-deoxy-D-manno-octulosonic-acid transferase